MKLLRVLSIGGILLLANVRAWGPGNTPAAYAAQAKTGGTQVGPGAQGVQIPQAKATGSVRHVDVAAFPTKEYYGEIIAGPTSGVDSCYFIYTRVQPGSHGPALHTHAVDQFYYVLSGTMNVQLGIDKYVVGPQTLVLIPAGTPHMNWNAGSVPEIHLEVIVPAPPLESLAKPASPRKVPNAREYIRPVKREVFHGQGFAEQWLARRSTGSEHAGLRADEVQPGSGDPGLHIHAFDQFYFVIDGTMNVELGLKRFQAGANTLVLIPAGLVHRNWNDGPGVERHITILVPEPGPGDKFEYPVEIRQERTH